MKFHFRLCDGVREEHAYRLTDCTFQFRRLCASSPSSPSPSPSPPSSLHCLHTTCTGLSGHHQCTSCVLKEIAVALFYSKCLAFVFLFSVGNTTAKVKLQGRSVDPRSATGRLNKVLQTYIPTVGSHTDYMALYPNRRLTYRLHGAIAQL
jgi:hypothetical protein